MTDIEKRNGDEHDEEEPLVVFEEDSITINFAHDHVETEEEVQARRTFYQQQFSHRAGREIPLDEISVTPEEGIVHQVQTSFKVSSGEPLYSGLFYLHQENPELLPKLVKDLEAYRGRHFLDQKQHILLDCAVDGLQIIIGPPKPNEAS